MQSKLGTPSWRSPIEYPAENQTIFLDWHRDLASLFASVKRCLASRELPSSQATRESGRSARVIDLETSTNCWFGPPLPMGPANAGTPKSTERRSIRFFIKTSGLNLSNERKDTRKPSDAPRYNY